MNRPILRKEVVFCALTMMVGIFLSFLLSHALHEKNQDLIHNKIHEEISKITELAGERIYAYQYGLRGVRGFVLAEGDALSRDAFLRYSSTRNIAVEFPGARGFGFIRRVPEAGEADFIEQARGDDNPDFAIRQLAPHQGERYIIQYIEPSANNAQSIGLDIASESNRRRAAKKAAETGEVQLTGPITLVQAEGKHKQSFLILLPIYKNWRTPETLSQRWQEIIGWSFAPLLMEEIIQTLKVNPKYFSLRLTDITEPDSKQVFYETSHSELLTHQTVDSKIQVFGRSWLVELGASPEFQKSLKLVNPLLIFVLGALISVILGLLQLAISKILINRAKIFRQQSLLAAIVQSTDDAIIGVGLDEKVTSWNPGASIQLGFSMAEAIGRKITELIVPADHTASLLAAYQQVLQGRAVQNLISQARRKDGQVFDVLINISPILDRNKKVIGFSKTLKDISDIKNTQRQLEELNSTLEQQVELRTKQLATVSDQLIIAAEVAKLGIWQYEVRSNRLAWNQRMFDLYQQPKSLQLEGLSYQHWQERLHPDDKAKTEAALHSAMQGLGEFDQVFRIVLPDGSERFIHGSARVERDQEGNALRVIGVNVDITNQTLVESELRGAKELSDAASEAKTQFLANMSHEIRTPMNGVLGMLSLIKQTSLDRQQRDYVNKIDTAARSLLNILDEILDFSKISAGKLVLDPIEFDLEDMLRELSVVLAGNHGEKPVEVILDVDPELPPKIIADKLRLQQVLINLAGNALKFTEKGHVIVRFRSLGQSASQMRLGVEVEDTGIGIAPEQQQRIFEGFVQAEASTSRRFGGSGLGLVISKRLLNLMGAELELKSSVGVGTLFSFTLELPIVGQHTAPNEFPAPGMDKLSRILIVDDNDFMLEVLETGLKNAGWKVQSANSAQAALEAIADAEKNRQEFDVILMDWNMPGMNGLDASAVIRHNTAYMDKPLIIMLTAYERELLAQSTRFVEKPFDELLVKPVTITQIEETIQYLCSGESPQFEQPDNTLPSLDGYRILVVEDNELNRQVASELLTLAGAQVQLAVNGFEGVEAVLGAENRFDIVLMDLQMPEMDGLEATRRIRADGRFDALPILAMTANASAQDRENCLAAGMNEHIGKPFDMDKLGSLIHRLCWDKSANLTETWLPGADSTEQALEESGKAVPLDAIPLVEAVQLILARFGNNSDLAVRMRSRFEQEAINLQDAMDRAVLAKDLSGLSLALHSLKGVAATLGATRLSTLCSRLEEKARGNEIPGSEELADVPRLVGESLAALANLDFNTQPREAAPPLNPQEIITLMARLETLLAQDDLGAVDLSQELAEAWPHEPLGQKLNRQVADLHFRDALETLQLLKKLV